MEGNPPVAQEQRRQRTPTRGGKCPCELLLSHHCCGDADSLGFSIGAETWIFFVISVCKNGTYTFTVPHCKLHTVHVRSGRSGRTAFSPFAQRCHLVSSNTSSGPVPARFCSQLSRGQFLKDTSGAPGRSPTRLYRKLLRAPRCGACNHTAPSRTGGVRRRHFPRDHPCGPL